MGTSRQPVIVVGNQPSGGNAATPSANKKFGKRLGNIENITQAVLWVGVISLVAVVVTVVGMVIDQMIFNNQTYKDQSDKTNAQILEINTRIELMNAQLDQLKQDKPE